MAFLNRSLAITLSVPLIALLGEGCVPVMNRPAPGERPAEIILPSTKTPGNLDRIRSDLLAFTPGSTHLHTRPATCRTCVVDVAIHSIGLTTDITPLNGPARFRIIGRVTNNDSRDTENEYSLKPGTEYVIWVAPSRLNKAATSRTLWGFLELPAGSTGLIQPDTIGYVERCQHPKPPGAWKSDADFKACEDAHMTRSAGGVESRPTLPAFFASSKGLTSRLATAGSVWFDCGGYCCTGTNSR